MNNSSATTHDTNKAGATQQSQVMSRSRFDRLAEQWDAKVWFGLLFSIALVVRFGYVLAVQKTTLSWGDEFYYDQLATNILHDHCFCYAPDQPSVYRPPLYPAVLALIYALWGHSYTAVLIVQAIAGAISALTLALIGRHLSGSLSVGLVAGALFTVNPVLVYATALLYTETLFVFLLLVAVYLWLKLDRQGWTVTVVSLGSGLILGVATLMRPILMFFPAWLIAWRWFATREMSRAVLVGACVACGMALVILPWSFRNLRVTGQLVAVNANEGATLWQGNNSMAAGGGFGGIDSEIGRDAATEVRRDGEYRHAAVDWIGNHPGSFVQLIPLKVYHLFSPLESTTQGSNSPGAVSLRNGQIRSGFILLMLGGYTAYYLFAAAGMIRMAASWRIWLLPYMLVAYPTLVAAVVFGATRYGLVAQPFLQLFAAEAAVAATRLLARRSWRSANLVLTSGREQP